MEPGPRRWETSAITTTPSLLPEWVLKDVVFIDLCTSVPNLLCIVFDQPSSPFSQEAVLIVLKQAAQVQPALMREQIESVRHKHRVAR